MKKYILGLILILFGSISSAQIVGGALTANTGWAIGGNSVTAAKNFGTKTNYGVNFITNNSNWGNIGTTGIFSLTTVQTPSVFGSAASGGSLFIGSTSHATKGIVKIGTATSSINIGDGGFGSSALHIARFTKGTGTVDIGQASSGQAAIWMNQNVPTNVNYILSDDAASVYLNGRTGNSIYMSIAGNNISRHTLTFNQFLNPTRIGALTLPSATLDVTGTMSVSSTSSLGGLNLTAGGYSVTSKVIDVTTGDGATINSPIGRFRKDATGAVFTLTNSFITANSIITLQRITAALTGGTVLTVQAGAGSATITFEVGATGVATAPSADCDINFIIMN